MHVIDWIPPTGDLKYCCSRAYSRNTATIYQPNSHAFIVSCAACATAGELNVYTYNANRGDDENLFNMISSVIENVKAAQGYFHIINFSIGCIPADWNSAHNLLQSLFNDIQSYGVFTVKSAGNSGSLALNNDLLINFSDSIVVGGTETLIDDILGPVHFIWCSSEYGPLVNLYAPVTPILQPDYPSGTSYAAPRFAASLGLILAEIRSRIGPLSIFAKLAVYDFMKASTTTVDG